MKKRAAFFAFQETYIGIYKAALHAGTRYGPLLQQWQTQNSDGTTGKIWLNNFWSYLAALCFEGGSYKELLQKTAQIHGMDANNPLQLCLYADEVIPEKTSLGNVKGAPGQSMVPS